MARTGGPDAAASRVVERESTRWEEELPGNLGAMAGASLRRGLRCFVPREDGLTYVETGDIPAMWLRDSSFQVVPYLHFLPEDGHLAALLVGVARMQARCIREDPYANAFNAEPTGRRGFALDRSDRMSPWVFERKFELDSLCAPIRFWTALLAKTGDQGQSLVEGELVPAMDAILDVFEQEQDHEHSPYFFRRPFVGSRDTLGHGGRGAPVAQTGMVWSGFRPSDDACTYGYLIPAEAFATVSLEEMAVLYEGVGRSDQAGRARRLGGEVREGIERFGLVDTPGYGRIYAYETDGQGHAFMADDANLPSLLSLPYLGFCPPEDPAYVRTRRFILSPDNPHYVSGSVLSGVGSSHTPSAYVWPLALLMQAMTSEDPSEVRGIAAQVASSDAKTLHVHESVYGSDPGRFTRPWFAWGDALLCELVLTRWNWLSGR